MSDAVIDPSAAEPTSPAASSRSRRAWLTPVMRHEMDGRFRGLRGMRILVGYLALLGGILWLMYLVFAEIASSNAGLTQGTIGRSLFESLLPFELSLVLFFGAGYAASQISGERERRTLSLLQITRMSPMEIVVGKWWAVTAWQVLLLVVGMPLLAAASFFGGVRLINVLLATGYMVVMAACVSAVAILISASVRRTTPAIVATFALLLVLALGPFALAIVEALIREEVPTVSLAIHAGSGLAAAAGANVSAASSMPSILTPFALAWQGDQAFLGAPLDQGRPWGLLSAHLGTMLAITWAALRLAAGKVRPGRGPRPRRSRTARTAGAQLATAEGLLTPTPPPTPAPTSMPPPPPPTTP